jgi:hypothetical protein
VALPFSKGRVAEFCLIREGYSLILLEALLHTATSTTIPRYVNEVISDVRCIKPGWYGMDHAGHVSTGPFSSRAECLESIRPPTYKAQVPPQ